MKKIKILLIDDNKVCLKILRIMLEKLSVNMIEVDIASSEKGLFDRNFGIYAIICVDLKFPILDGFEIIDKIRSQTNGDCPPMVMVSACVTESVIRECVDKDIYFVSKPIDKFELEMVLKINKII